MVARRHIARIGAAALAGVLALLFPALVAAQQINVTITPLSGGGYTAGQQVLVRIEWCGVSATMDGSSRVITFNGQNADGFTWYPSGRPDCTDYAISEGAVILGEGQNFLHAEVAGYGSPPPPPPPTCPPDCPPPPECPPVCDQSVHRDPPPAVVVQQDYNVWGGETVSWNTPEPAPIVTPDGDTAFVSPIAGGTQLFAVTNPSQYTDRVFTLATTCTGAASTCSAPAQLYLQPGATGTVAVTYSAAGAFGDTGTVALTATDGSFDQGSIKVRIAPAGGAVERSLCLTIAAGAGAASECGDLRLVHALPGVRTLNTPRAPTLLYNSQHAHPYPLVSADVQLPAGDPLPTTVRGILRVNGTQVAQRDWAGTSWGAPGQTRRVVVGFDADTFATSVYDYDLEIQRITGGSVTTLQIFSEPLPIVNRKNSPFGPGWWLAGYERLYFGPTFTVIWSGGQFTVGSDAVVWVGGDGSTRVYRRAGQRGTDTVYVTTPVDHPDSLLHTNGNQWVRLLSGGGTVTFTGNGIHRRTTNRLGYRTEFYPDSAGDWKLLRIQLPPDTTLTYDFGYSGTPARIASVAVRDSAPGVNRVTALNWVGDALRVVEFSGTADSTVVVFQYQAGGTNRIIGRQDRRRTYTAFTYDDAFRLASSRLGVPGADSIILSFCAAQVRGLAACSPSLVAPESAYAIFDGPRLPSDSADVMHFWVDRFGGPSQTRDPYGNIMTMTRGDPRWPALATSVRYPNGRAVGSTYDRRGNVASVADSSVIVGNWPTRYATTRYEWDQKWDEVTLITMPNGQLTRMAYDATTGNRLWQEDGRGSGGRVTFGYVTSGNGVGLLRSVTAPGGGAELSFYDILGDVDSTKTPLGWTSYSINDRLGRTTQVRTPVKAGVYRVDSTFYNVRGRVYRAVSYGPAVDSATAQSVIITNTYNAEGQPLSATRQASPDAASLGSLVTTWAYDSAGRTVSLTQPGGGTTLTVYDAAGNPIRITKPGSLGTDTLAYDRLNRVRRRVTPKVTYSTRSDGIGILQLDEFSHRYVRSYPWFSDPLTIPADTSVFAYDLMGNMVVADNREARVHRTYYPDGLLYLDSLYIRNYADNAFSHAYGMAYNYDANRRLYSLVHPFQLAEAPGTTRSTQYSYDAQTGELTQVRDLLGNAYNLTYNARGERVALDLGWTWQGGILDTMAYDLDGRAILHQVKNYSASPWKFGIPILRNDTVSYVHPSRPDRILNRVNYQDDMTAKYSALGHLAFLRTTAAVISNFGVPGTAKTYEKFTLDALGNTTLLRDSSNLDSPTTRKSGLHFRTSRYYAGSERLRAVEESAVGDTLMYDAAGNVVYQRYYNADVSQFPLLQDRASYYGGDGRLHYAEYRRLQVTDTNFHQNPNNGQWYINQYNWPWFMSFEDYRYDALGRRVLVRTRKHCGDYNPWQGYLKYCNTGTIRRTVWAGDQELYEIQAYGGKEEGNATATEMENDTLPLVVTAVSSVNYWDPNPLFGRVAYVNGPKMDQPIALVRLNMIDTVYNQPRVNWGPMAIAPHWNLRGRADLGTFADGGAKVCLNPSSSRCMFPVWELQPFAFTEPVLDQGRWFGTVIGGKEDGSFLQFRRNRYVDPATGRFTQQDPIGLAGGVNLYGFANGDPVNFGDPFGLAGCKYYEVECWTDQLTAWGGGTGFKGRVLVPTIATAVSLIGMDAVEKDAQDAAEGSGMAKASLALTFLLSAIPGGAEAREGGQALKLEVHHLFPQAREFRGFFRRAGIDINKFTVKMTEAAHRLLPNGLHTNAGGNWNRVWREFKEANPTATAQQIWDQLEKMLKDFGIM